MVAVDMELYLFGVDRVASSIPLALDTGVAGAPDVVITHDAATRVDTNRELDATVTEGMMHGRRWAFGRTGTATTDPWTFVYGDVCRADLASDGSSIHVESVPEAPADWLADLVVGWLLVYRLAILGRWAFHGSAAVDADGDALAIVGPSGAGKSSLVTAALAEGHLLLADDALVGAVEPGPRVVVARSAADVKLRSQAVQLIDELSITDRRSTFDERWAASPARGPDAAELRRLIVIEGRGSETEIRWLRPFEVTTALLRNSKVGLWSSADLRDAEFDAAGAIAASVDAIGLTTPETHDARAVIDVYRTAAAVF